MFTYKLKEKNGIVYLEERSLVIDSFTNWEQAYQICKRRYDLDFDEVTEIRK